MGIQKDKYRSVAAEMRRLAEERLCAETTELHPPRTKEATQRFVQVKWRLDGEEQL